MIGSVSSIVTEESTRSPEDMSEQLNYLRECVERAALRLPSQGPLGIFVYENPLAAYEHLPFEQAVKLAYRRYDFQPYYQEAKYREWLQGGRIRREDLAEILMDDLGDRADEQIDSLGSLFQIYLSLLEGNLQQGTDAEIKWLMEETGALVKFVKDVPTDAKQRMVEETKNWVRGELSSLAATPDARFEEMTKDLLQSRGISDVERWGYLDWKKLCLQLMWRLCHQGAHGVPKMVGTADVEEEKFSPIRHRDLLFFATGVDIDESVHELLIRYTASFVDQGYASWRLPLRSEGYFKGFLQMYQQAHPAGWMSKLPAEIRRMKQWKLTAVESIYDSLRRLGVTPAESDEYLTQTLMSLRGWAGMIWQLETRANWAPNPVSRETLLEFVAVKLLLERVALEHFIAKTVGPEIAPADLRQTFKHVPREPRVHLEQRAFVLFQLAQYRGWTPQVLYRLKKSDWAELVEACEAFPSLERRRVYQKAFERRYQTKALDAIVAHGRKYLGKTRAKLSFQMITCIDDREESLRRHAEEICPNCQTFGSAGFFGVPMYYKGIDEAFFKPLSPVVVTPTHYVQEVSAYSQQISNLQKSEARRRIGAASKQWHQQSRTFVGGIFTALLGPLTSIPIIAEILFPRAASKIEQTFETLIEASPVTELELAREHEECGPDDGYRGFRHEEMAKSVGRVLEEIGLTKNFARVVLLVGHGSSSLNNPHQAAYNCGACSGGKSGPNARAFTQMANTHDVRGLLKEQGIDIPETTVFIAGYHNTCNDEISYYDLDLIPVSHRPDFENARNCLEEARARNAAERTRRFETVPLDLTPQQALEHVQTRSADLSQARPEFVHPTNAITVVGRRSRTRGLFLDRRCFLNDYDPTQDDEEGTVLARILSAAFPVCGGINLLYYFSTVDVANYGCGSKLPHNIVSLLGVMEGAQSDLRPGLASQMVEIHEAMRMVFVVETSVSTMTKIMHDNLTIKRLVENRWCYLAVLDPESAEMMMFENGRFVPYEPRNVHLGEMENSRQCYEGRRGGVEISFVRDGLRGLGVP